MRACSARPVAPDGVASGSFREVVIRRLRYLPEATLALLQIAAVLGDTVSVADVAAVALREPGESPFATFFDYRVRR
jgi:predicted ATPase